MTIRRWLGAILGAGLLVAAATAAGCTVTTSDEPLDGGNFDGNIETPDSAGSDGGTVPTGCNECLFQQCSGSWAVCQNDQECMAIYTCATTTANCDQNCINSCFCAHPNGQNKYVALAACDSYYACNTCKTECPTLSQPQACTAPGVIQRDVCGAQVVDAGVDSAPPEDSGADSAPPVDAALPPTDAAQVQDCTTCTTNSCSSEKQACAPGSECEAYTLCLAACSDTACFDKCGTDHATGKAASQALENCTITNCKTACNL